MPTFTPPVTAILPAVSEYPLIKRQNPLGYRLFRRYRIRDRGVNVFKMSDGSYVRDDVTSPYPATDAQPNNAIAVSWYKGVATVTGLPNPSVTFVYYGAHSYTVTAAEAANLTRAGFGANLT